MRKPVLEIGKITAILSFVCSSVSCSKPNNYIAGGYGSNDDFKTCNITRIVTTLVPPDGPIDSTIYTFQYNAKGLPVSIVPNKQSASFNYTIRFTYDAKDRLTSYYGVFNIPGGDQDFFDLHTFGFDAKGHIIKETFYSGSGKFSDVNNGTQTITAFYYYEYDTKGRIKKMKLHYHPGTSSETQSTQQFDYDHHGNLVRNGIRYDQNMNIARTNAIWMFLRKDYSINNAFIAETYSSNQLPAVINETNSKDYQFLPTIPLQFSRVEYKCD